MAKELKLFLAAVGLPAAILLLLVLRLVTLEHRAPAPRPEHRMEMPSEGRRRPPMRGRRPGPWSERYDGDRFRWIVAGVLGLAALSTVSGGWVLMRSAAKAKAESRENMITGIWGHAYDGTNRTLDTRIAALRKKLGPGLNRHIETVYGTGYRYLP